MRTYFRIPSVNLFHNLEYDSFLESRARTFFNPTFWVTIRVPTMFKKFLIKKLSTMTHTCLNNGYNQSQIWNKLVIYNINTKEAIYRVVSEFVVTGCRLFATTKLNKQVLGHNRFWDSFKIYELYLTRWNIK